MNEQGRKPGFGCLFYTGIAIGMSAVVLIIASFLGYRYARSQIDQFTDTQPVPIAVAPVSEAELSAIRSRIREFQSAMEQGAAIDPLTVSADEANALIAATPGLVTVRGPLRFDIEGSNVIAQFSVPAEDLGLKPLEGRYINATGTFSVIFTNGLLNVNAQSLSAKGEPLPKTFMDRIRPQNFAFKLNNDPEGKEFMTRVHDVQVTNGLVVIIPKQGG